MTETAQVPMFSLSAVQKNPANTVILATMDRKHRKYYGLKLLSTNNIDIHCFFPRTAGLKQIANHNAFWGPVRITAIVNNRNDSTRLRFNFANLDFLFRAIKFQEQWKTLFLKVQHG